MMAAKIQAKKRSSTERIRKIYQEFVAAKLLGRVSSIDLLVSSGLLPVGYGVAAIAADMFGAAPVFLIGGLVSAGVVAPGLLHPTVRRVDE